MAAKKNKRKGPEAEPAPKPDTKAPKPNEQNPPRKSKGMSLEAFLASIFGSDAGASGRVDDEKMQANAKPGYYWCPGCQAYHPDSERDETDGPFTPQDIRDPRLVGMVKELGLSGSEYNEAVELAMRLNNYIAQKRLPHLRGVLVVCAAAAMFTDSVQSVLKTSAPVPKPRNIADMIQELVRQGKI